MSDDEKNDGQGPGEDDKGPGLIGQLKLLYGRKPIPFALGMMGISALAMVAGVLMLGDGTVVAPAPLFPSGG